MRCNECNLPPKSVFDLIEDRRKGAEKTNKNYTTEKRREAGKKAWENRKKREEYKKAFDEIMGNPIDKLPSI